MSRKPTAPEICPVCGEDVPRDSLACPECGADYNSGWRKGADTYDALDLPDDDFNYDEVIRKEFGSGPKRGGLKTLWWVAAIILIIVFIFIYFHATR